MGNLGNRKVGGIPSIMWTRFCRWLRRVSGFDRLFKQEPQPVPVSEPLPPAPERYRYQENPEGLRIAPLHFTPDGKPLDPGLFAAVQAYTKKQFGQEMNFGCYARAHALCLIGEHGQITVMGLVAVRQSVDISVLHVTPPTQDKDGYAWADQARDAMFQRERCYLEDSGYVGQPVLICIPADELTRDWRSRLVARIDAAPANRFSFKV